MEKENLRWYEAPKMELVDIKLQGMLCGSTNGSNADGILTEIGGDDI